MDMVYETPQVARNLYGGVVTGGGVMNGGGLGNWRYRKLDMPLFNCEDSDG